MKDHDSVIREIKRFFARDGRIIRGWVFGSFSRLEDGPLSDIDIAVDVGDDQAQKFSYFDLADVQFRLEQLIQKKVDFGFSDVLKANAAPQIMNDSVLIYEKPRREEQRKAAADFESHR